MNWIPINPDRGPLPTHRTVTLAYFGYQYPFYALCFVDSDGAWRRDGSGIKLERDPTHWAALDQPHVLSITEGGPSCCDLASYGPANELEDGACLGCGRQWTGDDYCDECIDAQHEAKNADELDEYMNDLCNRRTPDNA